MKWSLLLPPDIAQNSNHSVSAKRGQFDRDDKVTVMQFILIRRLFVF